MKYDFLKKALFKNLVIIAVAVGISLFVITSLYIAEAALETDYKKIKADIAAIENDYKSTGSSLQKARSYLSEYQNLSDDKLPAQASSVMDVSALIREARAPLEELKERYRLTNMEMSLTAPVEMTGDMKREKIGVVNSKVTLRFNAATDELALSFLEDMVSSFPGYVTIDSLEMNRMTSNINDAMLAEIKNGKIPPLVSVNVILEWMKLEDKSVPAAKPAG